MSIKEKYKGPIAESFKVWQESGIDTKNAFEILVTFYKKGRSNNDSIIDEISKLNYESVFQYKRTMLFFAGTELMSTKKQIWTEEEFLNDIVKLDQIAEKHGYRLENYLAAPSDL